MKLALAYQRECARPRVSGRLLAACAAGSVVAAAVLPALAQSYDTPPRASRGAPGQVAPASAPAAPEQQMLVEANQLVYDFDRETVTAIGDVKIYYGAAILDADRVVYDQKSGRLVATGGVRMLEPDGNILTAERMDITDDFRDGFISSLNVITIDRAYFAAQSAERRDGNLMIFRKGVYSACAPCREDPGKPPLWQIKAARIIHDQAEKTVYYQDARFEFLGVPIAYLPYFFHPDPTVKRKTGFLTPSFMGSSAIGYGVTTPFFWSLSPSYDVTFSPTYLTRQGLLMQTEWRQRLMNGGYTIRLAGIFQEDPDAFFDDGEPLSGDRDFRGSARTTGDFAINSRWSYGWDLHATTDRQFNRDYRISGSTAQDLTSTVYLTGLSDTNFFDMRGYYFNVQRENTEDTLPGGGIYVHDDQAEQAVVHPIIDHNYIIGRPIFGGELRFDSNLTSLTRDESDIQHPPEPFSPYFAGVAGTHTRVTSRATWQSRFIGPGGQLVTPFTYFQADAASISPEDPAAGLTEDFVARAMPAVGVEYEWPFLAIAGSSTHTFGPKAQLIVRPNEQHVGEVPNEDAQSLVFDDTTLFQWDKFSGYDRVEGGTRANVGLVYQGVFANGASIDALAGQSFQLAGENSFSMDDQGLIVGSGLESDASDYVGRISLNTGTGLALIARARFDDETVDLNRGEFNAIGTLGETVGALGYAYIRESPSAGIFEDRQEISGAASVAVSDTFAVLGSLAYDVENGATVTRSFGLAYADDCLELSAVYSETPDQYSDLVTDRQVYVRISLRTLGDNKLTSQLDNDFY